MKICKLKLKNLNSFRDGIDLDFEKPPLGDASLVAITGPTGAGKTTLLDAICVALYGKTPRLSGTTNQHPRHLISHGETEGFAEVYFEANNTRYHATWTIKRKGSPKGQLFDGSGVLMTTKVAQEVESILGLDFDAFRRSVMLAQGEFAAFLKASDEKRRTILEATAGISIYDVLKKALNDKVSEVETVNAEVADKLNKIPEASREQVAEAEKELNGLQEDAKRLDEATKEVQAKETREAKRTEEFKKLQSLEKRQKELLDQQSIIDNFKEELERARRAESLRLEKREFDNAKSELEKASTALHSAKTEKTAAEDQVKSDQTAFEKKEAVYQAVSDNHNQQMKIYTEAKSDVERAEDRFAEADKRTPALTDLNDEINTISHRLVERQSRKVESEEQLGNVQRFLEDNRLPSNRQQCLNRATGFLAELGSQERQLETVSTSKAQHEKKVSSLKREIKNLSDTHEKRLSEKTDTEVTLKTAAAELDALLTTGTREKWNAQKQQATKAQPIAQKYEATQDDLADAENRLNALNDTTTVLEAELEQIETDLANQTEVWQEAAEVVQRCGAEKESAKWANPINQLRQRLQLGEPCSVCGATDHPCADVVEPESDERLQRAEEALAAAKTVEDTLQANLQTLKTKQIQTEQNKCNTATQIEDYITKIKALRNEATKLLAEWQGIYPGVNISSKWAAQQIDETDTAIIALGKVEQAHTQASHACQIALQQFKICGEDVERETKTLNETENQLSNLIDAAEDLQADIASTKDNLWESLPDTFHGLTPKEAVDRFENKIQEVEKRESERDTTKTQLRVLDTNIEADQGSLEDMRDRHKRLETEIDEYRREGEAFLDAAREKTDGLTTEDKIDITIKNLKAELQEKENERDAADQRLQDSRNLLIEKQTTYGICEKQLKRSDEKFETAREAYLDKLAGAGFDSPEACNNAFRDEKQMQELTEQIDAHEAGKQQLTLEITELRTRFEEAPFDPEALGRIETQVESIGEQLQTAQQEVGAQQQKIDNLKDALEKREALGGEIAAAEAELTRWRRLRETIPANDLRDFALEIMFRQMGSIANVQLSYLTSERYQLKVEGIGDLSVVDHWNANEERPVETLSGGESFLTSLALALALSELSSGRAQLNSLFLDEGFGTLDTETLDVAIAALEGLRMQGRSIFLISHIQELTRRLPVKINVRKRGNGSSYIGH